MYGYGKYPIRDFAPKRTSYSGKRTRFRPGDGPIGALLRGNVVRFPAMRKPPVETALAGWGGRIRTSEWRNQNPECLAALSMHVLKFRRKRARINSMG